VIGIRIVTLCVAVLPGVAFGQMGGGEPIKTTICELKQTPEEFNGKMVRVRATVVSRFEWGGLHDRACDAYLLSDDDRFPALSGRTGEYAFIRSPLDVEHPERLIWNPIHLPPPVRVDKDESYSQYESYVLQKFKRRDGSLCFDCPLFEINVTVVGRFDHLEQQMVAVRDNRREKPNAYMAGFGHLNASLSRLVWQSVTDVVAKPIDPAVYEKKNP
jgi:hypothetical protein